MDKASRTGLLFGIAAALMWGLMIVYSRKAVLYGIPAEDVVVLRYGVAALIMLPWVARAGLSDLAGVGWARGAVLALCVGPLFLWLAITGFLYAPLSHGAVIQPSSSVLVATVIALALLGERLGRAQALGLATVLVGIGLIGAAGSGLPVQEGAWRGQIMFFGAGTLWAIFTICLRVWGVPGLAATAAVNVISALVFVPAYLALGGGASLAALPVSQLVTFGLIHGVMAGVLAIAAYGRAVALLGVSRAALFPAIVPAVALLVGVPLTGEWPSAVEGLGALLATAGLMMAMGAVPGLRRSGL